MNVQPSKSLPKHAETEIRRWTVNLTSRLFKGQWGLFVFCYIHKIMKKYFCETGPQNLTATKKEWSVGKGSRNNSSSAHSKLAYNAFNSKEPSPLPPKPTLVVGRRLPVIQGMRLAYLTRQDSPPSRLHEGILSMEAFRMADQGGFPTRGENPLFSQEFKQCNYYGI